MEAIYFNYREVAFILNKPSQEIKMVFQKLLEKENVSTNDLLSFKDLKNKFGKIRSIDCRYDGLDTFTFYLEQCKKSFRNYLNDKQSIKKNKFIGVKSVFYKILSESEVNFINENLDSKNKYLYKKLFSYEIK